MNIKRLFLQLPLLRAFTWLVLLCCLYAHIAQASADSFSKSEVVSDFDELYHSLISTHYNPYAYVSEHEFKVHYQTLRAQISQSRFSDKDVITLFQKLITRLRNGHTEIEFPVQAYFNYAESGGTLFPFDIAIEDGKALVRSNFSDIDSIAIGAEITTVNGIAMTEVLAGIGQQVSAERDYFEHAKIEVYSFPRLFWHAFGEHKSFALTLLQHGESITKEVSAIPAIEGFEMRRVEILGGAREMRFIETVAYLKPSDFSGDYEAFTTFIDEAFRDINDAGANDLIIDLRNNAGGDDAFSDYLISYIATKPFKWYSSFSLRTSARLKEDTKHNRDVTQPYWASIMAHENGERYAFNFDPFLPQDAQKRFNGRVWVLVNRQSHSQAAVAAATIQDYQFGTIVGEETGDYPSLYASVFHYSLPKTGINVRIAKGQIIRPSGSEEEQGVMPEIAVRDHLLDNNDEILAATLERINGVNEQ